MIGPLRSVHVPHNSVNNQTASIFSARLQTQDSARDAIVVTNSLDDFGENASGGVNISDGNRQLIREKFFHSQKDPTNESARNQLASQSNELRNYRLSIIENPSQNYKESSLALEVVPCNDSAQQHLR